VRIILDTNVLVSGLFFESGPPGKIIEALIDDRFNLVISPEILNEYLEIISELQKTYPQINIDILLEKIFIKSDMFISAKLAEPVCPDPKDDMFIACAIASKIKIVVSGDKHLLGVSGYQDIKVLKPREFLEQYLD